MSVQKMYMMILMENNLDVARAFYEDLGLTVNFHVPNKWVELELDGVKLGLCPTDHEPVERRTGLVLQVDDLNAIKQSVSDHNISFLKEPVEALHGRMTSIKDPHGNIVDLYEPTHDRVKQAVDQVHKTTSCSSGTCKTGSQSCGSGCSCGKKAG